MTIRDRKVTNIWMSVNVHVARLQKEKYSSVAFARLYCDGDVARDVGRSCRVVVRVGSSCTGAYCPSAAAAEVAAGPQTGGLGGGLGRQTR